MTYMDGLLGLHGWQWMFIVEGLPATLLAGVVFLLLPNQPAEAKWLAPRERDLLGGTLKQEHAAMEAQGDVKLWRIVQDPRVWGLGLMFGSGLVGLYGLIIWLPLIIKELGALSDIEVGFLSALPPALGVMGALLVSRHSDMTLLTPCKIPKDLSCVCPKSSIVALTSPHSRCKRQGGRC